MGLIKQVFGWLGRRGIVFVALIAAMLIYQTTKPSFEGLRRLRSNAAQLANGENELAAATAKEIDESNEIIISFDRLSRTQIARHIDTAEHEREAVNTACGSDLRALVKTGAAGVIENRKQCLRGTVLTREIDSLKAIRSVVDDRDLGEPLPQAFRRHAVALHRAAARHRALKSELDGLDHDYVPDVLQQAKITSLQTRIAAIEAYGLDEKKSGDRLLAAQRASARAAQAASAALAESRRRYHALVEDRAKALSDNAIQKARAWAEANHLLVVVKRAAYALFLIIVMPYLIRLFCYLVLAPVAMRRPAIRLAGASTAIPPSDRSTTSVAVRLNPGEELLVRQEHLQSASHAGMHATQWLLDWRHPVTSIATGLAFLTRVRGDGEVTTVSAVQDTFAEVAVLTLPDGGACVLQPRAIAAVVQPIGRPMRVRTKWRFGSINAWLTMQLRYVVFSGPARLIIKGGRGVRVERAERGRVFGQEQLIGFSADLAYSVTRAETFWPYFLGREQLLKDRVQAGDGVLIVEEAPMAAQGSSEVRHGIEGLIDAALKVFGL